MTRIVNFLDNESVGQGVAPERGKAFRGYFGISERLQFAALVKSI